MADILVVGAGPVGLTLAVEFARRGVIARIIDKNPARSVYCRAIGVTPRTLEVFEDMGIARELVDSGLWLTGSRTIIVGGPVRDAKSDFSDLPYSPLGVPQYATEAVLESRLAGMGVTVERGVALSSLEQRDDGRADVQLETSAGTEKARFKYVVGCDGAHSSVRRALGIDFDGDAFPMDFMLGDVHIAWGSPEATLPRGVALRAMKLIENDAPDMFIAIPLPEQGRYRVSMQAPKRLSAPAGVGTDHGVQSDRPGASLSDLQEVADRVLPEHASLSDMRWSSIFRISMRLAARYRVGNTFIAGDACHIHPPTGGQGMNTGIQDTYNLGWKLALVATGRADPALLDSYEAERHPVAADVVARTTEQSINFGRERAPPHRLQDTQLLVAYRESALSLGPPAAQIAAGDRVPDVQGLRRTGLGFPLRLFDLLKGTRLVFLVMVDDKGTADIEACALRLQKLWPGLVRVIAIASPGTSYDEPPGVELIRDDASNFVGTMGAAPRSAWLVRPDNYVGLATTSWSETEVVDYLRTHIRLS